MQCQVQAKYQAITAFVTVVGGDKLVIESDNPDVSVDASGDES